MIIELNLIQNFLLSIFIVLALGIVIFSIRKVLIKEGRNTHALPMHPATDESTNPNDDQKADSAISPDLNNQHDADAAITNYDKLLKVGRHHARSLLYETAREAGRILNETKRTNEKIEEDLDKVMHKVAENDIHVLKATVENFDQNFNKNLAAIQTQMQTSMNEMIENTKKQYDQKLDEFMQEMMKKGLSSQSEVDKKTAEMLTSAENEITEYKKNKLSQVDEQISELIQKVYRDVLRISMPENIHEELIVKSLDQAKKDGLFKL